MVFNAHDLDHNTAFHIWETSSSNLFEARIIRAVYVGNEKNIEDIEWRVIIDAIGKHLVLSTDLIHALMNSVRINEVIELNVPHDESINNTKSNNTTVYLYPVTGKLQYEGFIPM